MNLLFKNKTKYSKEVYTEFLNFHNSHYKYSYIVYTAFISISLLFFIFAQVQNHHINYAFILCSGLTCFILYRFFHPIFKVSKEYKSEKIQNEKEYTFKFYEKNFTVEDQKTISTSKYSKLYRVFETEQFFYLYIDRTHSLLLENTKFSKGDFRDFSDFIRKKCWFKYKKI